MCPVSEEGIQTVERSADARAAFRKGVRCGRARDGMPGAKERMLNGEAYDPDDPELVADRERARELTGQYNRTAPDDRDERRRLLEDLLGALGDGCHVEPPFRCDYGYNIYVGENVYVNFDCVILDVCRVEIGRNCDIGPGVHIYTATHPLDATERAAGTEYGAPVTVGDNVWIGGRAVLNPGVTVGDDAVIASGAVVTDDVPENVVVGGNPATVIRDLGTDE
jgi:maltose O-acetyltransferase